MQNSDSFISHPKVVNIWNKCLIHYLILGGCCHEKVVFVFIFGCLKSHFRAPANAKSAHFQNRDHFFTPTSPPKWQILKQSVVFLSISSSFQTFLGPHSPFSDLRFWLTWKVERSEETTHTQNIARDCTDIKLLFSFRPDITLITCLEGIKSLFLSKFYCVERKQLCTACTHINPCFWTHGGFFWAKNVVVFSNSLNYSQVQKNC